MRRLFAGGQPALAFGKLTGDLTLLGVTRPETLDLEFLGTTTDQYGNSKVAFQARAAAA